MKLLGQILFPLLIIAIGFAGYSKLKSLKPPKKSKQAKVVIPVVSIADVSPEDHTPPVRSFGTVQSYFETTLTPQVTGEIVEVSEQFKVGVMVKKGELLARIDATDYHAILAGLTATKVTAMQVLAEEEIRVKQASEDWVASGRSLAKASDFVLRKPQLAAARANIKSAEAAEAKAKVDIERTVIRAPYDAVVLARSASLGNLANSQQSLGRLVATEKSEVRLPLSAEQFSRVKLPVSTTGSSESGQPLNVTLTSPSHEGLEWQGDLVRTEAVIDEANQVSYVIAEIENPYTSHTQPLAMGTFVNALIPAVAIKGAYKLNEAALVNDKYVWALDTESRLQRLVAIRRQSYEGDVFLTIETKDLTPPLKIVTRPLTNFKSGDEVSTGSDSAKKPSDKGEGKKRGEGKESGKKEGEA